jgi:hypothetical protein
LDIPAALAYVTEKRGWQLCTVKAARLGYMPQDKRPLLADLNLSDNWRTVFQKFPPNMIVYVHTEQGRHKNGRKGAQDDFRAVRAVGVRTFGRD